MAVDTISAALGIPEAGPLVLMDAVRNGLPLTALDSLVRSVAPRDNRFAFRIVARATLARRRKALAAVENRAEARLSSEEGARLARLAAVWAFAVHVWKSDEDARRFMFEPHPLLHDRRPVDLVLESELGRPVVESLLGKLEHGSAV